MKNSISPSLYKGLILLFIPAIILALSLFAKEAAGPYWLGANSDPAYLYLINSLYIVDGHTPYFVDHPGTPIQLFGALVIKIFNLGKSRTETLDHVFEYSELYLHIIYYTILFLYVLALALIGLYAYRKSRSLVFALWLEASGFLFFNLKSYGSAETILPVIANVNSDTLLLSICTFYFIGILRLLFPSGDNGALATRNNLSAVYLGFICALGMATKLTFFPYLLGPLILLPHLKTKGIFILTFLATWMVSIAHILSRFQEMHDWVAPIIRGDFGTASLSTYLGSLKHLIYQHGYVFSFLIVSLLLALMVRSFKASGESKKNIPVDPVFILTLIIIGILQFVFMARKSAPQYMVPAYCLTGLVGGLLYLSFNHLKAWRNTFLFMLGFYLLIQPSAALSYIQHLKKVNTHILDFSREAYNNPQGCVVIGYYRSSSPQTAIEWAEAHGQFKIYSQYLNQKFPQAYFFNIWHNTFHNFDKNVFLGNLLHIYPCAMLYGSAHDFGKIFVLEEAGKAEYERLYFIKSTTLDDAHKLFMLAENMEMQKRYKEAYLYAVMSKEMGRPGTEGYIKRLEGLISP